MPDLFCCFRKKKKFSETLANAIADFFRIDSQKLIYRKLTKQGKCYRKINFNHYEFLILGRDNEIGTIVTTLQDHPALNAFVKVFIEEVPLSVSDDSGVKFNSRNVLCIEEGLAQAILDSEQQGKPQVDFSQRPPELKVESETATFSEFSLY